jgi:alkylated DNA repair protein alkB family protein 8
MLRQLVRLIKPGGTALVTVWALEQEEPRKTLDKWTPVRAGTTVSSTAAAAAPTAAAAAEQQGADDGQASLGDACTDYMVPWNIPFHRAHAALAASQHAQSPSGAAGDGDRDGAAQQQQPALAHAQVQQGKGVVVFQRYYHLFKRGELEALVARVPGCSLVSSVFDKSNWCVVLRRDA